VGELAERGHVGGGLGEQAEHLHLVHPRPRRLHPLELLLVEHRQPDDVAVGTRRLGHGRTDAGRPRERRVPRLAQPHGVRRVEEEHAPHRHVVLELLRDEHLTPGRRLPRDHLRRVAGAVLPQVEQFAPAARPPQAVDARRGQAVQPLGRPLPALLVGQGGQHQILGRHAEEDAAVEEPAVVGESQFHALELHDPRGDGVKFVFDVDGLVGGQTADHPPVPADHAHADRQLVRDSHERQTQSARLERQLHADGRLHLCPQVRLLTAVLNELTFDGDATGRGGGAGEEPRPFADEPEDEGEREQAGEPAVVGQPHPPERDHPGHDQEPDAAGGEHEMFTSTQA
jgi:hypothetical protein